MRLFVLGVLFVNLLLLNSCKKHQPADVAFFMKAGKISVATKKEQGSGSHKITDLWLYVNGKFQGTFPVGNLMPIVTNGKSARINIFAGIKNNGISDTRTSWPFYSFLTFDTLVESGKTIERPFTFVYNATTSFTWTENFEDSGLSLQSSGGSSSLTIAAPEDSFEGRSAQLELLGTDLVAQVESSGKGFSLPPSSSNVYLELNYKSDQIFTVGLIGESGALKSALSINPQQNWNKIYIQLSTVVSTPPVSSKYKVYFQTIATEANPHPKVFFDNIKLVYL